MSTMNLTVRDGIHVLTLTNADNGGDNMLTTAVLLEYQAAFDAVERYEGNTALLITSDHEKTFTTGINLAWLRDQSEADQQAFGHLFDTTLCRLALLTAPSVACINGNAYAGGAIIAAATDFRVMRADRGRFCLPEVNIKIPFTPVSAAIVDLLPNKQAVKHMMLTGVAFTGTECLERDIVDSLAPVEQLHSTAEALAKNLAAKDRATYVAIRNATRDKLAGLLQGLNH